LWRLLAGNFGDTKLVEQAVWELRLHFGPGLSDLFGLDGGALIILLSWTEINQRKESGYSACLRILAGLFKEEKMREYPPAVSHHDWLIKRLKADRNWRPNI